VIKLREGVPYPCGAIILPEYTSQIFHGRLEGIAPDYWGDNPVGFFAPVRVTCA